MDGKDFSYGKCKKETEQIFFVFFFSSPVGIFCSFHFGLLLNEYGLIGLYLQSSILDRKDPIENGDKSTIFHF